MTYIVKMKKSVLTIALVIATLSVGPLAAQSISLSAISGFLNNMRTAKGAFTQINPDGSISTGTIYIHRPGRVRFEYDPPNPALVIAGGGTVAIFDQKSDQAPQQFPLRRTPLSVILQRNVDLERANMITSIVSDETSTTIVAQDPERPEIGYIELVFTADPIELRQWVITDEAGSQTTVILRDLEMGLPLSSALFSVQLEMQKLTADR